MIDFHNLKASFKRRTLFQNVSGSFKAGDKICLVGPNGSGKTTLLKLLSGLLTPQKGTIGLLEKNLDHYSLKELSKLRAYMPAQPLCHWDLWVEEFLDLGLLEEGKSTPKSWEGPLKDLGLEYLLDHKFQTLSSGEKWLISFVRGVANGPKLCLMDEPLSHLYEEWQERLLHHVDHLSKEGVTTILISHHVEALKAHNFKVMKLSPSGLVELI